MQTTTSKTGGGAPRVFHRGSIEFNQGFGVVRCDSEGKIYAVYAAAMRMRDGEVDHLFYTLPNQLLQTPDNLVIWQKLEGADKTRRVNVVVYPELLATKTAGVVVPADPNGTPNYREIMEESTPGGWWGAVQFGRNSQSGFWATTQWALRDDWALDTEAGAVVPSNKRMAFHEDAAEFAKAYPTAWEVFIRAAVRFGGIEETSIPVGGSRQHLNVPGSGLEILEKAIEADKAFRDAKKLAKEVERLPEARVRNLLDRLSPESAAKLASLRGMPARPPGTTVQ